MTGPHITIVPHAGTVVAEALGHTLARSDRALDLREGRYPVVVYIPLDDVDPAVLRPSEHKTRCPFKGDARYWSLAAGGRHLDNAVWSYPTPNPDVAAIAGHVAFDARHVSVRDAEG